MKSFISACLTLMLFGCAPSDKSMSTQGIEDRSNWTDPSPHESHFLELNGYRLNYLDWGGAGKNMVFVPGQGDSPHIFDDFAPKFTDQYRVIAYARRGHGQSSSPPDASYDVDTLTEDLRIVMDRLGMETATIVGFSMGCLEANRFGNLYPERVEKIIYLDGAYDYSDPRLQESQDKYPGDYTRTEADMASNETLYNWFVKKAWRKGLPDSDALWASVVDSTEPAPGGGVRLIVDPVLDGKLWESVVSYKREFSTVEVPSLAIFGIWSAQHSIPEGAGPELVEEVQLWKARYNDPWHRDSIEKFRSEAPNGRVVELPETHHAVFLHRPERVLKEMNAFLNEN